MPIIDDYLLKRSDPFTLGSSEEDRADLTLTQSAAATGRVRGLVTDAVTGDPIGDAVVKLRTQSGDPIAHTLTNPAGRYTLSDIATGTYTLNVTKQGYLTSSGQTFTITRNQIIDLNVALTPESVTNTIYGIVTDLVTSDPIDGVNVVLTPTISTPQNVVQAISSANGEYILASIPDGTQVLLANVSGYYVSSFIPIDISGGSILNADISLQPYQVPQSTVNGYIKNQSGTPVANACVGLYLINTQNVEILQQITYTDTTGFYIFGRVSAGTYVVKAKSEKNVTVII